MDVRLRRKEGTASGSPLPSRYGWILTALSFQTLPSLCCCTFILHRKKLRLEEVKDLPQSDSLSQGPTAAAFLSWASP